MKDKKKFEIIDFIRGDDVVINFIDICGFTHMIDKAVKRNNEKEIIKILNKFYDYAADIIYEEMGIVDKYLGDGIMALFGGIFSNNYDILPKDYLLKAIEVSLKIESFVNTLGYDLGLKLELSSGIWMGNVFIGISTGEAEKKDISVIGDSVNISARLQKYASSNEIIIPFIHEIEFKKKLDEVIVPYGKVKYYEKVSVKGKDKPLNVFRIMDEAIFWEKYGN
ncbi:adenylate/guanylate cyclase domain-containing protein [bacterium]|nr:adenylate/guanylate cyclase domain-containing protein [bacterium]